MDFIKLSSVTAHPTQLSFGEAINGWTKALWVERYREPGEFKLEAPLSSGLVEFLPLGSFVTHMATTVVMWVENHEINEPIDEDPTVSITGRCFTTYMEHRSVGDQQAFLTNQIDEWIVVADQTWDQVVTVIDGHLINPANPDDEIIGWGVNHTVTGLPATVEERDSNHRPVYTVVQDILKVDDLGIKTVRPTPTDPLGYFTVYRGVDVSTKVRFSWTLGDLDSLQYFFSNKKLKNQARVMGRYVQVIVNPTGVDNFGRRTIVVDASDIDGRLSAYPSGGTLTSIISKMQVRGRQALKAQNKISITQADISENARYQYRRDYQLGDLVTVDGNFNQSAVMRVIEFAEAEDETGASGHPTLAIPGET
jgi:hypothetical protein